MPTRYAVVPIEEAISKQCDPDTYRPCALVVDDERIVADSVAAILRTQGFAAIAAYDAGSALELARLIPPQLLISDVSMPGMNGFDLAVAITLECPDCKVLIFSGRAENADLLDSPLYSKYDFSFVSKPVHQTELLARASRLVQGSTIPAQIASGIANH